MTREFGTVTIVDKRSFVARRDSDGMPIKLGRPTGVKIERGQRVAFDEVRVAPSGIGYGLLVAVERAIERNRAERRRYSVISLTALRKLLGSVSPDAP